MDSSPSCIGTQEHDELSLSATETFNNTERQKYGTSDRINDCLLSQGNKQEIYLKRKIGCSVNWNSFFSHSSCEIVSDQLLLGAGLRI